MPEQRTNYYEIFPEISPEMRAGEIRQALEKKAAVLAARFDEKSLKLQDQIEAALGIFRDEAGKQAYDRALAECRQTQQQEDPLQKQREQLEHWRSRARILYDSREFDLAKPAIERALASEMSRDDSKLYLLAARIYSANGDHDTAFRHINEAIVLEPEAIELTMHKAEICFSKAEALAKRPGFQNDAPLQEEYQSVRAKGLKLLDAMLGKAKDAEVEGEDSLFAEIVGMQACELYFRPDKTDAERAAREKKEGLHKARAIEREYDLNDDDKVTLVLKEESRKQGERAAWKKRAGEYFSKNKYTQAEEAIEHALAIDVVEHSDADDAELYNLAASIYYYGYYDDTGYNISLKYIDQALALEPDNVDYNVLHGAIYSAMAALILDYGDFRSSLKRQNEYTRLRSRGLEILRKAVDLGREKFRNVPTSEKYKEQYAEALDTLAYVLYYRSDALNAAKAREEEKEALMHARRVQEIVPDGNKEARNILEREDRRKSERDQWGKRAREYRDKKEWKQAQNAISQALDIELAEPSDADDAYLYWLAASIYHSGDIDCDIALQYINKGLALNPDGVYKNVLKGFILGKKAMCFECGQKEYESFRALGLECLRKAVSLAQGKSESTFASEEDKKQYAYALGALAHMLYFKRAPNASKARAERKEALAYARLSRKVVPDGSGDAKAVLQREEQKKSERSQWKERAREYYNNGEWKQAKNAISQAWKIDLAERSDTDDEYLYWMAATICCEGDKDYETALKYINKALALRPDDVYDNVLKGEIYRHKIVSLIVDGLSSRQQKEYEGLRALQLESLRKAVNAAHENFKRDPRKYNELYAYALGYLAMGLAQIPDHFNASKARAEEEEALTHAQRAQEVAPNTSEEAMRALEWLKGKGF